MAMAGVTDEPPPYFGIDPKRAEEELGPALGTAGFADLAQACARGRQDLVGRGLDATGQKVLRRFSTWEITRYLIPVAPAHFRRVLRQNPDLPQGLTETEGGAKWFTLDEVLRLRAHFAAEGSKAKDPTAPTGPRDCRPRSSPSRTSRAAWARPPPRRIWRCRPRSMATGCWWWISTARAR
jgi:chromosome partitioning protein